MIQEGSSDGNNKINRIQGSRIKGPMNKYEN